MRNAACISVTEKQKLLIITTKQNLSTKICPQRVPHAAFRNAPKTYLDKNWFVSSYQWSGKCNKAFNNIKNKILSFCTLV